MICFLFISNHSESYYFSTAWPDFRLANGCRPCDPDKAQLGPTILVGHRSPRSWGFRAQALNLVTLPLTRWGCLDLSFFLCGSMRRMPTFSAVCEDCRRQIQKALARWVTYSKCSVKADYFYCCYKSTSQRAYIFSFSFSGLNPPHFPFLLGFHIWEPKTWKRERERRRHRRRQTDDGCFQRSSHVGWGLICP